MLNWSMSGRCKGFWLQTAASPAQLSLLPQARRLAMSFTSPALSWLCRPVSPAQCQPELPTPGVLRQLLGVRQAPTP